MSLYAVAFGLLLASAVALAFAGSGLLTSRKLIWTSTVLSGLAVVVALASVLAPRR